MESYGKQIDSNWNLMESRRDSNWNPMESRKKEGRKQMEIAVGHVGYIIYKGIDADRKK